ncbi:PREDICTED: collagen alpha-1(I) chain-like [Rhinopithecus bieti]|uniref:collagen alpha-1(I) chain-like n=1 Tax=Rhinopithecus bieti TaxID=61621 RepID=UPI00083BACA8|nr:PREDICTED: collagen alpha-1(I) chain-like [Rhinopithecus bieti]
MAMALSWVGVGCVYDATEAVGVAGAPQNRWIPWHFSEASGGPIWLFAPTLTGRPAPGSRRPLTKPPPGPWDQPLRGPGPCARVSGTVGPGAAPERGAQEDGRVARGRGARRVEKGHAGPRRAGGGEGCGAARKGAHLVREARGSRGAGPSEGGTWEPGGEAGAWPGALRCARGAGTRRLLGGARGPAGVPRVVPAWGRGRPRGRGEVGEGSRRPSSALGAFGWFCRRSSQVTRGVSSRRSGARGLRGVYGTSEGELTPFARIRVSFREPVGSALARTFELARVCVSERRSRPHTDGGGAHVTHAASQGSARRPPRCCGTCTVPGSGTASARAEPARGQPLPAPARALQPPAPRTCLCRPPLGAALRAVAVAFRRLSLRIASYGSSAAERGSGPRSSQEGIILRGWSP